jgi:ribosomal protein S8
MEVSKALLILKNTLISRKKNCFVKKTIKNRNLLIILAATGLLTFTLENSNYKVNISNIFLRTSTIMKLPLKNSKKQFWSNRKIIKETQTSATIFIFDTSFGFLTQQAMLKKNLGGVFLCSFSI